MPRPPIQHHRVFHHLVIEEDTLETLTKAAAINAAGKAAQGALSNPLLAPAILGAVLGLTGSVVGIDVISAFQKVMAGVSGILNAKEQDDVRAAGNDLIRDMRAFLNLFLPSQLVP